jgi:hypothetical protein
MGLFDSIQNLISGATDMAQGSIGDVVGNLGEIPAVQDIQDIAGGATEAATTAVEDATETLTGLSEQGQATIEDLTSNLGL